MATNPGTTNLIAWWSLDETGGNRADSHGSNTLTDVNTVASAAGKVGTAADFEASNSEYLSIADNAALSMGAGQSFTISAWVKAESMTLAASMWILGKRAAVQEYQIAYLGTADGGTSRFVLTVNDGAGTAIVTDNTVVSAGAWYHIAAWCSAGAQLGIKVNAATGVTAATSRYAQNLANPLEVGVLNFGGGLTSYWDGLIDEVCIYKRVLTDDEITWLYNAGAGRAYSELGAKGLPVIEHWHNTMFLR